MKFYEKLRYHLYQRIANYINRFSRYYDSCTYYGSSPKILAILFALIDCKQKKLIDRIEDCTDFSQKKASRDMLVLNGTFNTSFDIEELLSGIKARLNRHSRVVVILYNPYMRWLYWIADKLHIRRAPEAQTFVSEVDLRDLAKLSHFELVSMQPLLFCPFHLFGLGKWVDSFFLLFPFLRNFSLSVVATLRPVIPETEAPSLSIVIPARNEKGNIENAIRRLPRFGNKNAEVIFVEGHSTDGTWQEIERVAKLYSDQIIIKCLRQTGKGKVDAVRAGFSCAEGDLLTILDADLTMPPEMLPRFYDAYCRGDADFINGSRLVYPMEGEAMRFLNRLGNIFFAKALSWVLNTRMGDTLCGTKLMTRHDYERTRAWRGDFGDFDPFGDFELLFPASILQLDLLSIPVRYRDRTYGSTNISRFRHGFMLLKMTLIGFARIKLFIHDHKAPSDETKTFMLPNFGIMDASSSALAGKARPDSAKNL